jgi:hypothetical protein
MMKTEITQTELAALKMYATAYGRCWKDKLRTEWMNASAEPTLHRLRNTHGPIWLTGFRFPKETQAEVAEWDRIGKALDAFDTRRDRAKLEDMR